ncbi:MAG: glycosyltransferase [Flavobacteriales bacterium]|nr:glycosyltransferase [Flavobacteriales bacterium]MBK9536961.1 glycosyltransferase [Flavobacteriales bacterium]HQX31595.1 glycosyltransferase [Flavobacteriales bacterium]
MEQNSMTEPLLSVVISTYDHVKYIEQCINSALMQRTDLPFEILIGEDESTDGTREVCKRIADEHPDRIRLFLRSREDVIYIQGKPTGRYNLLNSLNAAKGKYIALCDGDDYWTDPLKIQKQVDFLEANPDHSICFHRAMLEQNGQLVPDSITEPRFDLIKERPVGISALLEHGNLMHTNTVVFRNFRENLPFELFSAPMADYLFHVISASKGFIHRLDDAMSVYRVGVGIFSSKSEIETHHAIVVNQAHVLSLLTKEEHRMIALAKFDRSLNTYIKVIEQNATEDSNLLKRKSGRDILRLLFKKITFKK